jgi:hypothetical protein
MHNQLFLLSYMRQRRLPDACEPTIHLDYVHVLGRRSEVKMRVSSENMTRPRGECKTTHLIMVKENGVYVRTVYSQQEAQSIGGNSRVSDKGNNAKPKA